MRTPLQPSAFPLTLATSRFQLYLQQLARSESEHSLKITKAARVIVGLALALQMGLGWTYHPRRVVG